MAHRALAFHLVQATDFHLDADRSRYDWNRFGIDSQEASPEQLSAPAQLLEYLDEVDAKANWRLDGLGPAGLLARDYHGTFPTGLDHVLYTLRHAQHHVGQGPQGRGLLHRAGAPIRPQHFHWASVAVAMGLATSLWRSMIAVKALPPKCCRDSSVPSSRAAGR